MDPISLGLGALSAGGSLLSGIGASQAAAKTAKMQRAEDYVAYLRNQDIMRDVNHKKELLGRELLTIPETHTRDSDSGSWVDVDAMMAAAERSGFNPVTFLNAGGMQAYTRNWSKETTTSTGHNAAEAFKLMDWDYALTGASQVPAQSSMLSAFGGALSAGANTFGTQYRANQSYDMQMARLGLAQSTLGSGLSVGNGMVQALSYGGAGSGSGNPTGTKAVGGLSDLPYPQQWKMDDVKVTNPFYRGFIDSKSGNAELGEDRYGEAGEFLFGLRNIVNDSVRNVTGRGLEDWGTAAGMNIGSYKQPTDTSWAPAFNRWWTSPTSFPNTWLRNPVTNGPGYSSTTGGGYMPFPGANAY